MFCMADIIKANSFPALFAGSPVQDSSVPKTANFILQLCNIFITALVIFFALSSKLPAQPTQNKISGTSPAAIISATVGTLIFSLIFNIV